MKKILSPLVIGLLVVGLLSSGLWSGRTRPQRPEVPPDDPAVLRFFWSAGCPFCQEQQEFLDEIGPRLPGLRIYDHESQFDQENRELLMRLAQSYGLERPSGTPITFIGPDHFIGFDPEIASEMLEAIQRCLETGCPDPLARL